MLKDIFQKVVFFQRVSRDILEGYLSKSDRSEDNQVGNVRSSVRFLENWKHSGIRDLKTSERTKPFSAKNVQDSEDCVCTLPNLYTSTVQGRHWSRSAAFS
jgi:hypothetical protein